MTLSLESKDRVVNVIKRVIFVLIVALMIFLSGRVGQLPDLDLDLGADDATINFLGNAHCYSSCAFMGNWEWDWE